MTLPVPVCPWCNHTATLWRYRIASGWTVVSACQRCRRHVNRNGTTKPGGQYYAMGAVQNPQELPVWMDERSEACAVCGARGPVELHHLAPFVDGYAWPTVLVCRRCHERWHRRMTGYQWSSVDPSAGRG